MASIKKEIVYRDIPLSFTPHPVTGNIAMLTNEEAVKQSVKNIVLTNYYERPYKKSFGGNVTRQLFENMDSFTEFNLSKSIRTALENYEPRATIIDIKINPNYDSNTLTASIKFSVKSLDEPLTVNVILQRVR